MKHVLKKFLYRQKLSDKTYNQFLLVNNTSSDKDIDTNCIIAVTDDQNLYRCFQYERNGQKHFIPEPNPVVIYFHTAQSILDILNKSKSNFLTIITTNELSTTQMTNSFYQFFGVCSNFVTSLSASLEAFVNLQIPNNFEYKDITKQRTILYNKSQIQRSISIEDKIKKVIPEITNKSFHKEKSHLYESILILKDLRNEVVHTKSDVNNNNYQYLFNRALDFNYKEAIFAVREYINFYSENLIEDCPCGKTH